MAVHKRIRVKYILDDDSRPRSIRFCDECGKFKTVQHYKNRKLCTSCIREQKDEKSDEN